MSDSTIVDTDVLRDQVREKYGPWITGDDDVTTHRHVIELDGRAIGLIQHYRLEDEPAYAAAIGEAAPGGAGIDLLIGEVDEIGRGVGAAALDAYVRDVVFTDPSITRATAGPHPDNRRSCRAFEKAGFVAVRKKGKLPWRTVGQDYALEYGTDRVEVHTDAIDSGEQLLVVDDLIATGGTISAALDLIQHVGGQVVGCAFVIDLPDLGGSKRLRDRGVAVHALCEFEGD